MTEVKKSDFSKYVSPNVYNGIRKLDPEKAKKRAEALRAKLNALSEAKLISAK